MPPRYIAPDPFAGGDDSQGHHQPQQHQHQHQQQLQSQGRPPPPAPAPAPAPPPASAPDLAASYPTYDSHSDTVHVQLQHSQPPLQYSTHDPLPQNTSQIVPTNHVSFAPTPPPPRSVTLHDGPRFPSAPAYPPTSTPVVSNDDRFNYGRIPSSDGHRNVTNPFESTPQMSYSPQYHPNGAGVMMSQVHDDSNGSYYHDGDAGDVPLLTPRQNYGFAPASAFTPDGHLIAGAGGVEQWGDGQGIEDDDAVDGMARGRKMMTGPPDGDSMAAGDESFPGGWASNLSHAEDGNGRIRYGRIPQRVPRRYKTLKRVELYHGNLVLDCPVPSRLLERLNDRESREFTHMRYTAATCDPDKFKEERYTLRQVLFDPPRRTELFIVLTMYNEDEELFCRTLHGVMTNIAHLCTRERSKTWGKEGWKKVVVCIVSDGRLKINARVLSVLAAMGVYQEGVGKNVVNGKPVTAHIYEYTTQLSVDPDLKFRGREKGIMPVQILFCLKERNQKKINSHRWFFNAFGSILQPNVCVLLDVGTMPRSKSIYHLWKAFDINSNVAGACGEIVALKGKLWTGLLNPLVAAQNFEYKMSNILDKPLESVFGYISVLPGAFSAYRYLSLQNDALGQGPLASYFKGETLHGGQTDADIFTSNMYLAEDRILCWELCAKRDSAWILHYVKSAQAVTDVPDGVPELISQRRRWLNGSFFAGIHSIVKFGYIYRSSHSFGRKFALHVELVYQTIQLIFSWFGMANFFIAFSILSTAVSDEVPGLRIPGIVLSYIYVALIVFNFLLAMGNRPAGSKWAYIVSMILFALLTVWMTGVAIFLAVNAITVQTESGSSTASLFTDKIFVNIVISLVATYGVWLISSLLALDPWHMFTSLIQYLLMAPTFVNIINIYAFCNTHDVSWGTKGSDKVSTDLGVVATSASNANEVDVAVPTEAKDLDSIYSDALHVLSTKPPRVERVIDLEQKQKDYYATVRTNVVTVWAISNAALAIAIINGGDANVKLNYMAFLLYSVAGLAAFRMIGCIIYLAKRMLSGE